MVTEMPMSGVGTAPALAAEIQTLEPPIQKWTLARRIAFRFCFAYLVLYIFPFPLAYIPGTGFLAAKYQSLWNAIVVWTGKHILRLSYDITVLPNESGDTTWNYVQVLCFVILAASAALIWSLLDRRRESYRRMYEWLRLLVRFSLASALIEYGLHKVIPVQMYAPPLSILLEPYGDSSPMGLLWTFMGASKGYEIFTGSAELLGGLLLILPRTTALGALLGIADMAQVFALNMFYDVPVKLYSFHLLLMGIFLIAPDLGRLMKLFLLGRKVELVNPPTMFGRRLLNRGMLGLQIAFGLFLIGTSLLSARHAAKMYGFLSPKPPMYGIWSVEEFKLDGEVRPPLFTDATRWRRVIFDFPGSLTIQLGSGARQRFRIQLDTEKKTLTLAKREDPNAKSDFSFEETEPGLVTLTGDLDGHRVQANLQKSGEGQFRLTNRGFHWINEYPLGR
jgi:uncharacterized membrane protein YphA (DoxX/SURF4 family)